MSAAMVTSFFNDYSPNVMYGKNGGNFAAAASRGPQQVLESRRHSSSSVAGHGMHHHGVPPLRRSTSSVTPVVLRTTSPKPCRMPPVQGAPAGGMVSAAALVARTDHRKLDRSYSEPVDRRASLGAVPPTASPISAAATPTSPPPAQNSSRYKTELCRPFEESGTCKYGDKCQFAHGGHELRTLARHPKYKTELCRTFHTTGFCPYGPRCHFIHNSDESRKNLLNNINGSSGQPAAVPVQARPKALSVGSFGSLGSAGDLSPPSSPMYDDPFSGGSFTPNSTTCNTAFSFSQDFATLVAANALKGPNAPSPGVSSGGVGGFHHGFGGSQPALAAAMSPFSALSLPDTSAFPFPALVGTGGAHRGAIIEGPPSPVDSLGSELDTMSVNGGGGSPAPGSCSSPLSRLPIFNRLANGRDSD
ncbi:uncharacterized protein LOC144104875 isoform X1 [Amblyomma americanum]